MNSLSDTGRCSGVCLRLICCIKWWYETGSGGVFLITADDGRWCRAQHTSANTASGMHPIMVLTCFAGFAEDSREQYENANENVLVTHLQFRYWSAGAICRRRHHLLLCYIPRRFVIACHYEWCKCLKWWYRTHSAESRETFQPAR